MWLEETAEKQFLKSAPYFVFDEYSICEIRCRLLPHSCVTVGERGHADTDQYSGTVQRQDNVFCGGRLGRKVPGVGEGSA